MVCDHYCYELCGIFRKEKISIRKDKASKPIKFLENNKSNLEFPNSRSGSSPIIGLIRVTKCVEKSPKFFTQYFDPQKSSKSLSIDCCSTNQNLNCLNVETIER